MKIKDVNFNKELYEEIRYNKNTNGYPISVAEGKPNEEKRRIGATSIFGVMGAMGYYDEAKREAEDDSLPSVLERMIDNSEERISNKGIKL